ncbi:MAG: hypothetical protein ACXADY_12025 [Candidatus Hodarchaeales archaeon]|jgi:hypothetical protein
MNILLSQLIFENLVGRNTKKVVTSPYLLSTDISPDPVRPIPSQLTIPNPTHERR